MQIKTSFKADFDFVIINNKECAKNGVGKNKIWCCSSNIHCLAYSLPSMLLTPAINIQPEFTSLK